MDMSELASLMLDWEKKHNELMAIEAIIETAVLDMGKTQTVGNVRASYSAGRKSYDYETVGREAPVEVIAQFTEPKTDWRAVCKHTGLEPSFTQGDPYVNVKLLGGTK